MAVVTQTDRPKSVRNHCVIDVFAGVFVLSPDFFLFSEGIGAFVMGLSQISSFYSSLLLEPLETRLGTVIMVPTRKTRMVNIFFYSVWC